MTDKRMEEMAQEIEGHVIRQMNTGAPGPYLPPELADLEAAIVARLSQERAERAAKGRAMKKAGAVDEQPTP